VGVIFLRQGESFVPMREEPYEAEDLLQALIAAHPQILSGDDRGEQSQWALVKREAGVGSWSLDHLFLDQAGVPTLVEVKRSSDTRARREVVAQMLDYAANAAGYWTVETLRRWFEAQSDDPEVALQTLGVADAEEYWEAVKTNLAAERIRLVFVSDEIPAELRSIVEFLNRQMSETEVYAIEVKQYVDLGGERQTIVPRVLGQTQAAKAAKAGGARQKWDKESFLAEVDRSSDPEAQEIAEALINWAESDDRPDVRADYGTGMVRGSASIKLAPGRTTLCTACALWTDGTVQIPFIYLGSPFSESRDARDELRRRINDAVPEADIPTDDAITAPDFSLRALSDERARRDFLGVVEWVFEQARQAHAHESGESPSDPG
jgi:hypothetical protein